MDREREEVVLIKKLLTKMDSSRSDKMRGLQLLFNMLDIDSIPERKAMVEFMLNEDICIPLREAIKSDFIMMKFTNKIIIILSESPTFTQYSTTILLFYIRACAYITRLLDFTNQSLHDIVEVFIIIIKRLRNYNPKYDDIWQEQYEFHDMLFTLCTVFETLLGAENVNRNNKLLIASGLKETHMLMHLNDLKCPKTLKVLIDYMESSLFFQEFKFGLEQFEDLLILLNKEEFESCLKRTFNGFIFYYKTERNPEYLIYYLGALAYFVVNAVESGLSMFLIRQCVQNTILKEALALLRTENSDVQKSLTVILSCLDWESVGFHEHIDGGFDGILKYNQLLVQTFAIDKYSHQTDSNVLQFKIDFWQWSLRNHCDDIDFIRLQTVAKVALESMSGCMKIHMIKYFMIFLSNVCGVRENIANEFIIAGSKKIGSYIQQNFVPETTRIVFYTVKLELLNWTEREFSTQYWFYKILMQVYMESDNVDRISILVALRLFDRTTLYESIIKVNQKKTVMINAAKVLMEYNWTANSLLDYLRYIYSKDENILCIKLSVLKCIRHGIASYSNEDKINCLREIGKLISKLKRRTKAKSAELNEMFVDILALTMIEHSKIIQNE